MLDKPAMSEEQKTEEGKKMFSIFAARMFEQRVLQAYREKVAQGMLCVFLINAGGSDCIMIYRTSSSTLA